ncbi:DUF202 domain-containing protein [Sneathiella sp.]|uniref:DUF202 domain-containing protein n=1 Tax=Sneathiella sp. TaxID=1964365 RepID=UPI002FE0D52F
MKKDARALAEEECEVDPFILSVHRTELANRRTLLAYIKTAIALTAGAVALLKFSAETYLHFIGWCLLPLSLLALLIGLIDYHRVRRSINREKRLAARKPKIRQ